MIDDKLKKKILDFQRNEITEYYIYKKLASSTKNRRNSRVLNKISKEELEHYKFWKKFTSEDVDPYKNKILKYSFICRLLGLTFGIRFMEKGEKLAQKEYKKVLKYIPKAKKIIRDEDEHENALIDLIDEERLRYTSSVVLGLNDALVELTGALAGLTFAFQKSSLIAVAGLITGIAASLSMGSSEYLSTKSEESKKNPLKASLYTTVAYLFTVLFLIFPYFVFDNVFLSLGLTVINAIVVVLLFTFYLSVAKNISFKKRFMEMVFISLGIATLTFIIGLLIRKFLGIQL